MELQTVQSKIYELRGQKVILDFDLAILYDVPTKALKQAVNRNRERFPEDFMFELSLKELETLRSHFVTSKSQRGGIRYAPYAFTEQGVAMLSSVLKNKNAVEVNISIMRAFVFLRKYALNHKELADKLKELENKFKEKFTSIEDVLIYLLQKDNIATRKRIGFKEEV